MSTLAPAQARTGASVERMVKTFGEFQPGLTALWEVQWATDGRRYESGIVGLAP